MADGSRSRCSGLVHATRHVTLGGLWLEFGVSTGGSLRLVAEQESAQRVYGFDSCDGLPEAWVRGEEYPTFEQGRSAADRKPSQQMRP